MTPDPRITALLDRFDFERAHRAMSALDWIYGNGKRPTIDDLRQAAGEVLTEALARRSSCDSGGFLAMCWPDGHLSLYCVVEDISEEDPPPAAEARRSCEAYSTALEHELEDDGFDLDEKPEESDPPPRPRIRVWDVARAKEDALRPRTACAPLPEGYDLQQVAAMVRTSEERGAEVSMGVKTARSPWLYLDEATCGEFYLVNTADLLVGAGLQGLWTLCRVDPPRTVLRGMPERVAHAE